MYRNKSVVKTDCGTTKVARVSITLFIKRFLVKTKDLSPKSTIVYTFAYKIFRSYGNSICNTVHNIY